MSRFLGAAMSRRSMLSRASVSGAGLAAAALIGCSSSGNKAASTAPSGNASAASTAATSAKPKPGGTLRYPLRNSPDSIDPYRNAAGQGAQGLPVMVYSRLFTFEAGDGAPASGKVIGDLVKTWEQPDPLTLLLHIDPAAKFDQKEPLNGRNVTSDDVVQSWKRYSAAAPTRVQLVNALNKDAPIETIEAVDASTVRVKLKFVDSTLFALLPGIDIQPAEGIAGKIDLSKEARGSGPFLLDSYNQGVSVTYKRNPTWFRGGGERPYVDSVVASIIPDQAQYEVQFRAKKLQFASVSRPNIPGFAKELPGTEVAVGAPDSRSPTFGLSYLPGQPWNDVRVRRAVSMAIDRDAFADVILNPKQYTPLGAKLTVRWNAPIAGGYGAYWLDAKSPKFGPAAAYLQHNVAEATKQLAAAGFSSSSPMEFDIIYAGTQYGTDWPTRAEALQSMVKDAGVKANLVSVEYATDYIPKFMTAHAQFKGRKTEAAVHFPPGGASADPLIYLFNFFGSGGTYAYMGDKFPAFDEMMRKQRQVIDFNDRVGGIQEMQRWATDNMIVIPVGPDTETVDLVWKGLRGPQQFHRWSGSAQTPDNELFPYDWFQEPV